MGTRDAETQWGGTRRPVDRLPALPSRQEAAPPSTRRHPTRMDDWELRTRLEELYKQFDAWADVADQADWWRSFLGLLQEVEERRKEMVVNDPNSRFRPEDFNQTITALSTIR